MLGLGPDDTRMELNYLATPLVTVAGIPDPPAAVDRKEDHVLYSAHQLERVTVCERNTTLNPVVSKVAAKLAKLSVNSPQWDPRLLKNDRIHIRFCNYADLCLKTPAPSILSPKHKINASTSPIFTPQWVDKYMSVQPAAVVAFFDAPEQGSAAGDDLIAVINGLVDELAQSGGTQLMAVCVGSQADLARVTPILRRETDLTHPTQLLALADDLNEEEISNFVGQLFYAISSVVDVFFNQKLNRLREKRKNVAPPLDLMMWDARYTLKLAFCSEFKGDVAGAMRLYESAYDSLSVMFENGAISVASPAYKNARDCLDLIALKIFQHSLPLKMAYGKLLSHIDTITQLLASNKLKSDSSSALAWKASQYAIFAQLCTAFKQMPEAASNPILQQPGGIPTGLIWLDAACLYARADISATDSNVGDARISVDAADADADADAPDTFSDAPDSPTDVADVSTDAVDASTDVADASTDTAAAEPTSVDPYDRKQKLEFTPQHCFITAISDLSEFRRSKAYALTQYGDWLSAKDSQKENAGGENGGAQNTDIQNTSIEKTEDLKTEENKPAGSKNSGSAAAEAYKSASRLLAPNTWPQTQRYLGAKLNDQLTLFALGEPSTLSLSKQPISEDEASIEKEVQAETEEVEAGINDTDSAQNNNAHSPTVNDLLFHVSGNWRSTDTHIGREIEAQVTVSPKLARTIELGKLIISTSWGTITFVHDEKCPDERIVIADKLSAEKHDATKANLRFTKTPKVFQFGNTPIKTGVLTLDSVTVFIGKLSQTLEMKRATNQWMLNASVRGKQDIQTLHLGLVLDPRRAEVSTRPAKLKLTDLSPPVAALEELFKFVFDITSSEEENVDASIVVHLVASAHEEPLKIFDQQLSLISGDSKPVRVSGTFQAPPALFELKVFIKFDTTQDTLPVTFEYTKEVDAARPFRVTFDVVPEYFEHEWPAVFAPTLDIPAIPRKWRLTSTSLATFESEQLILRSTELDLKSKTADFTLCDDSDTAKILDIKMPYNSVKRLSHSFLAQPKDSAVVQSIRSFEAAANIVLKWSRTSTPEIVNTLALPSVRLNLPTQEPRVLVVCESAGGASDITQVAYHIENATSKLLNFSVQMSSSTHFAYQGPRIAHVKMLPFSTRKLTYQLVPLGDGTDQGRRPLPDLRVFDVNYKRILPIAPGNKSVFFDQGTLFI